MGEAEEDKRHIIPADLREEILVRLPANNLENFKLVCKDWLQLISSPRFIQKHLHRSKATCDGIRILIPYPNAIIDYNDDTCGNQIYKEIPYPPGFSVEETIILGSCDGLICLADKQSCELAVLNPSTGKSDIRKIDGFEFKWNSFFWAGHHPSTGEYVLVEREFSLDPLGVIIKVYEFSRELMCVMSVSCLTRRVYCLNEMGILLQGNLHWPALEINFFDIPSRHIILAYDFQKNEVLEICPPRQSCFKLGVVDGCLCAALQNREIFELWIMKEYGVEQSWKKYRNIEGYQRYKRLSPFGFFRNGDIILNGELSLDADKSKLTKYSFRDKKGTLLKVPKYRTSSRAILCDDTLVSPAMIWGNSP